MSTLEQIHQRFDANSLGLTEQETEMNIKNILNNITSVLSKKLSEEEIMERTDRNNVKCVFHPSRFVGQDNAVERLLDVAYSEMTGNSVGSIIFDAAPSSGKTYAAKLLSKAIGYPLSEFNTSSIRSLDTVINELKVTCEAQKLKFKNLGKKNGKPYFEIPSCVAFFDEFHQVSPTMLTNLLRPTEKSDSTIITKDAIYDCSNVLWIFATTHIGTIHKMNSAMLTRMMTIRLESLSKEEVAKIIMNVPENKHWTEEDCLKAVNVFGLVVREVLRLVEQANIKMKRKRIDIDEALKLISDEEGINQGMRTEDLRVLQVLFDNFPRRTTYSDIVASTNLQEDTLREMIFPRLSQNNGRPLIVRKNLSITQEGANELLKRDLITKEVYQKFQEVE